MQEQSPLTLSWDIGTAYDFLISLEVLHRPADLGLPRAWAAGVRARLAAPAREALEAGVRLFYAPLHWIYTLPPPRDSAVVLWALGQRPPADRLPTLALRPDTPAAVKETLQRVAARGAWDGQDEQTLRAAYGRPGEGRPCYPSRDVVSILDCWADAAGYGERYLEALRAYQASFFGEEEKRILPAMRDALARAQDLAARSALPDLLEELTQGIRLVGLPALSELVLFPSYWCAPASYMVPLGPRREIWSFGARPAAASLVPGEAVPDAILFALRALADPTRLRILRALGEQPLTQAQLTRRLRLRASTITHHLHDLRLAGLIRLTMQEAGGREKYYALRTEAVGRAFETLSRFLAGQD